MGQFNYRFIDLCSKSTGSHQYPLLGKISYRQQRRKSIFNILQKPNQLLPNFVIVHAVISYTVISISEQKVTLDYQRLYIVELHAQHHTGGIHTSGNV